MRKIFVLSIFYFNFSCQTFNSFFSKSPASEDKEEKAPLTEAEKVNLIEAKVWSRLDALDKKVTKHAERLKLIEQALILGIPPKGFEIDPEDESEKSSATTTKETVLSKEIAATGDYDKILKEAQTLFQEGKVGPAYLKFSRIERDFSAEVHHGEPHYWIGRCWFVLKEFKQSKDSFDSFIGSFAQSSLIPSSRFYLAQIELQQNHAEKGIKQLQTIISEYPDDTVAEEARLLLKKMRQNI